MPKRPPQPPADSIADPAPAAKAAASATADLGWLAETLVAQWLTQQGGQILQQRWRCRWGELDLVAQLPDSPGAAAMLVFVEVKARRNAGWDAGGLLSITPQKQAKLWQAAALFLAEFPALADLTCRFDVALVSGRSRPISPSRPTELSTAGLPSAAVIQIGQPVAIADHSLTLQHYIPAAFGDLST